MPIDSERCFANLRIIAEQDSFYFFAELDSIVLPTQLDNGEMIILVNTLDNVQLCTTNNLRIIAQFFKESFNHAALIAFYNIVIVLAGEDSLNQALLDHLLSHPKLILLEHSFRKMCDYIPLLHYENLLPIIILIFLNKQNFMLVNMC